MQNLKFFISDIDKKLQISDLKFGSSEIKKFTSEKTLKTKVSDLKLNLRNFLLNYNLCILSEKLNFF